jgi:capsule polysaccharide export protein KpsE/RkpR
MKAARLEADYARLRAQLEALQAAPEKDFPKIDALIDELEKLQLAIKAEHGIKGNNPNE